MSPATGVVIRTAVPEDWPLVISTWVESACHGSWFAHDVDRAVFYREQRAAIGRLWQRPSTVLLCACVPEDPATIVGWACFELRRCLHFIYVKKNFRGFGVARALEAEAQMPDPFEYSTRTASVMRSLRHLGGHAIYNPFALFQASTGEVGCRKSIAAAQQPANPPADPPASTRSGASSWASESAREG